MFVSLLMSFLSVISCDVLCLLFKCLRLPKKTEKRRQLAFLRCNKIPNVLCGRSFRRNQNLKRTPGTYRLFADYKTGQFAKNL